MKRKINLLALFILLISSSVSAQVAETGNASFYADKYEGELTASGQVFSQSKLTAAHRTLPFGTKVRVTNLENQKSVEVVINDRGPFTASRIIDVSKSAAQKLDFISQGKTKVKIEVIQPEADLKKNIKATNTSLQKERKKERKKREQRH